MDEAVNRSSQQAKGFQQARGVWKARHLLYLLLVGVLLSGCNIVKPAAPLGAQATLTYSVYRDGSSGVYHADSLTTATTYTGTLKSVVQSAVLDANAADSGTIRFAAGDFDLGSDYFYLVNIADITFEGQGIDVTTIRNDTSVAADTEPFNCTNCDRVTVRDLTVSAGGSARSSSDALDFDYGDYVVVERVKVSASRARGIIFDGKGFSWTRTADHNVIRDCVITGGVLSNGIELLASSFNRVENCTISDVGGTGIQVTKASSNADTHQANKPSDENVITGNTIMNAGRDGVGVNSSNLNIITNNVIMNSSDDVTGRDGINLYATNSIVCNDNTVDLNTASDNQTPKTQAYGLKIVSPLCNRTVVGTNDFAGNRLGTIFNGGTGTIFSETDTLPPSVPNNLNATAASSYQVNLSWSASSDNVGVTSYELHRNGALLGNVGNVTFYSDTSVSPNTTYTYQVRARDAAANWSALSSVVTVTTPPAIVLTLAPVADAYVQNDMPLTNYGSSSLLTVDGSPIRHVLLKFNVTGVGNYQVTKATLRLYNTNSSATGGTFYRVDNTSWSETGITWSNAPAADPTPITSLGTVASGNWYDVDVTSVVLGDGLVSIKIISSNADAANYTSRSGTTEFRPQLVIDVAP